MTDFLQLRNLKTVSVASDEKCYVVKAEGVASWVTCPSCELGRLHSHGMQKQSFKDIPSHGKSVEIHILRRRYRCIRCGKTMFEPIDDLDGKRHATVRLVKYICEQSFSKTFAALAREVALDEKTIRNIFDDFVKELDAAIRFRTPRVLGIDEVKIIGHYRAILTNIEKNTLFDIRPSRAKADLLPYFQSLRDKERIKWVTMDMYHVYKQIVRATLPQAQIVVDRFHIQRMANDALDNLRKGVRKLLSSHQRLKLKDERFLLLKHRHTLSDEEIERVSSWFDQFPLLGEAHALKEDFFAIWAHNSRADAEAACRKWLSTIPVELMPTFKPLVTAIHNWHEEIFAYFDYSITNAYTESVNRLVKDMNRMGRGYSFEVIRARMLYEEKARKDGAVIEIVEADSASETSSPVLHRMTLEMTRKKRVRRVVEYGPYIPTLCKLLEDGYFET